MFRTRRRWQLRPLVVFLLRRRLMSCPVLCLCRRVKRWDLWRVFVLVMLTMMSRLVLLWNLTLIGFVVGLAFFTLTMVLLTRSLLRSEFVLSRRPIFFMSVAFVTPRLLFLVSVILMSLRLYRGTTMVCVLMIRVGWTLLRLRCRLCDRLLLISTRRPNCIPISVLLPLLTRSRFCRLRLALGTRRILALFALFGT